MFKRVYVAMDQLEPLEKGIFLTQSPKVSAARPDGPPEARTDAPASIGSETDTIATATPAGKPAGPVVGANAGKQGANQAGRPAGKPDARPGAGAGKNAPRPVPKPVSSARLKRRHWAVMISFLVGVLLPVIVVGIYLYNWAADEYASTVAFSVRTEEQSSALELLGGITELSGSSSSDTDILYEYLQSQKLVADIDKEIDLRKIWSKPDSDPVFSFDPDGTIEDLTDYWNRMVRIDYDDGAGLLDVRVLAFDPDDATLIAQALFEKSSAMINDLSTIAREDAIRYSREELATAVERLKKARREVTIFRNKHQLVDPQFDLQTQAGLLAQLETQLAESLIELDLLSNSTRPDDPRVTQAERRIDVIEKRIAAERSKLGIAGGDENSDVYANLFGEYESLVVDREFAERTYIGAQAAYDSSLAEARRQSRYLAAYVQPTRAESSRYPERLSILGLSGLFILLTWATLVLVVYAIKDRR